MYGLQYLAMLYFNTPGMQMRAVIYLQLLVPALFVSTSSMNIYPKVKLDS